MRLLFALLLLSFEAGAATYYIDPTCGAAGDGTSQDCGAGASAPLAAYPTLASNNSYLQKAGTIVIPAAELLLNNTGTTVGAYGTGATPVIDGSSITLTSRTIRISGASITVQGVRVIATPSGATANAISLASSASAYTIDNVEMVGQGTVTAVSNAACLLNSSPNSGTISNSLVTNCNTGMSFNWASFGASANVSVTGNRCEALAGNAGDDSDCITLTATAIDYGNRLVIENNDLSGFAENGVDLGGATQAVVRRNRFHSPRYLVGRTWVPSGVIGGNSTPNGGNSLVERNECYDMFDSETDYAVCIYSRGSIGSRYRSNVMHDVGFGIRNNTTGSINNEYANNTISAYFHAFIGEDSTTGSVLRNNVLKSSASGYGARCDTGSTCTGDHNAFVGATEQYDGAGTWTNAGDDVTSDPAFLGGQSPTTANGFKPNCQTSPLKDTGTYVGQVQDFSGRYFTYPPEIGAFACQGGTPRATATNRTTATQRTTATARVAAEARP